MRLYKLLDEIFILRNRVEFDLCRLYLVRMLLFQMSDVIDEELMFG